jgi:hypothetical protein
MAEPMYEVRVAGVVPDTLLREMQAITAAPDQVSTVLHGLGDEAALYGLLARLRSLGLEVMEVHRVSSLGDEKVTGPEPSDIPGGEAAS